MYLLSHFQGVASKKHKEGSVHKLLMLLAIPKIQELHYNLRVLLAELGLESLDFVITSDIKMGVLMSVYFCSLLTGNLLLKFSSCWARIQGHAAMPAPIVRMGYLGTPPASSTPWVHCWPGTRLCVFEYKFNIIFFII